MTDLQVEQPVFTLVLHSMFRLRATTLPAIFGLGVRHSRLSRNTLQTRGRIVTRKKSEQTNQMMQHDSSPGPWGRGVEPALDTYQVLIVEARGAGVGASSIG